MDKEAKRTRASQITNKIADAGAEEIAELGIEVVQQIISTLGNKLKKLIEKAITQTDEKTKQEIQQDALDLLQEEIDAHKRIMKLGEEKKEIAFMFAMKKLRYSEEQMDLLLDTAGRSYKSKDNIITDINATEN